MWELGAAWGLVSNFIPFVAGLDPENIKGPLGISQVWRLDNIDDIRSALNEINKYLADDAPNRVQPGSDKDKALRQVVSIAKKYSSESESIPIDELYTLRCSNKRTMVQTCRAASQDFKVFQDFKVSRNKGNNVNAVHYLWADTFANGNIKALVITENEENYLRVWFENGFRTELQGEFARGYACNLEVWPPEHVLENKKEGGGLRYTCLQFCARIPKEEIKDNYITNVGLSVRLLDRRLTRWVYRALPSGRRPTQFCVTDCWQAFKLQLMAAHYTLFTASGNHLYLKCDKNGQPIPDFTVLAGITFIMGCYSASQEEPRDGKGVIDIKDIRLIEKSY